jgi:hypothetical protein
MFEKEAEEYAKVKEIERNNLECIIVVNYEVSRAFKDGAEFGYNKANERVKDIIVRLIANQPDTYSGTDIEFNQKKMFKFSKAVSDAQDYLKGVL